MSTVQTMCENESRTMGRWVEIHTVKMWKQHRLSQNFVKMKSIRLDKIVRTNYVKE